MSRSYKDDIKNTFSVNLTAFVINMLRRWKVCNSSLILVLV